MCWTRTDRQISEHESERFATKKDEGEAFRTGKVLDAPKPAPENPPGNKDLVNI